MFNILFIFKCVCVRGRHSFNVPSVYGKYLLNQIKQIFSLKYMCVFEEALNYCGNALCHWNTSILKASLLSFFLLFCLFLSYFDHLSLPLSLSLSPSLCFCLIWKQCQHCCFYTKRLLLGDCWRQWWLQRKVCVFSCWERTPLKEGKTMNRCYSLQCRNLNSWKNWPKYSKHFLFY